MSEKKEPEKGKETTTKSVVVAEKNITDHVLNQVRALEQAGALRIPANYSPENALKSAFLVLQEVVDKDKKPVLQTCKQNSIAIALLDMVVRGLNPIKKQCYFIPYGDKLTHVPSYFGNQATAKRCGMREVRAVVIFEGDEFEYKIVSASGRKELVTHEQQIENIDIKKIRGAYAIVTMEDGTTDMEIMTRAQINQAWLQGATKGNSPAHQNFTDEMAKRTVITRACKQIINTSDDAYLFDNNEGDAQEVTEDVNAEVLNFDGTTEQPEASQEKEPEKTEPEVKEPEKKEGEGKGPGF